MYANKVGILKFYLDGVEDAGVDEVGVDEAADDAEAGADSLGLGCGVEVVGLVGSLGCGVEVDC